MALTDRELLTLGPSHTLLQNVVYALPARSCRVHSVEIVEISVDGSAWDSLTDSNTVGAFCSSTFVRCTTGNTVMTLKVM